MNTSTTRSNIVFAAVIIICLVAATFAGVLFAATDHSAPAPIASHSISAHFAGFDGVEGTS